MTSLVERAYGRAMTVEIPEGFLMLNMPTGPWTLSEIDLVGCGDQQVLSLLDLESGLSVETPVMIRGSHFQFAAPVGIESPMLVIG